MSVVRFGVCALNKADYDGKTRGDGKAKGKVRVPMGDMKAAGRAMGMEGDGELDQEQGDRERLKNEESGG